mmetsp:Transcript_8581/g.23885  ORF Transcript_8581/g.23885 Transcript_8581/m.23885 type:complete len:201 (+) Transcript_8581:816-1418(+)
MHGAAEFPHDVCNSLGINVQVLPLLCKETSELREGKATVPCRGDVAHRGADGTAVRKYRGRKSTAREHAVELLDRDEIILIFVKNPEDPLQRLIQGLLFRPQESSDERRVAYPFAPVDIQSIDDLLQVVRFDPKLLEAQDSDRNWHHTISLEIHRDKDTVENSNVVRVNVCRHAVHDHLGKVAAGCVRPEAALHLRELLG